MKTIGLIGGTSWQSTVDYYRIINSTVESRLQGHSAKLILFSLDFNEIDVRVKRNAFSEIGDIMIDAAKSLERAGVDCIVMCANTMHMFATEVQNAVSIPLIHIVDAVIPEIKQKQISKLGLLGTKPTMQMEFYKEKYLAENMQIIIPDENEMGKVHDIIFTELFKGIINPESKKFLLEIIDNMIAQGAQGIILGCTELPLIIQQDDCKVPVFDTTEIHAHAAVDFALKD
jgi:aspartate racemase